MKRRFMLAGGLLLAALGTGTLAPHTTFARISVCRSDPLLSLSNGKTLQVTSSISDSMSDIKQIAYSVQLPSGVSVKKITYTSNFPAGLEQVSIQSNQPVNTYVTTTTVTTGTGGLAVTATDSLTYGSTTLASGSGSGSSKSAAGIVAGAAISVKLVG